MSLRDDVVLRVVHQLIEALLRAAGLRRKKDLPAAEQALGDGLGAMGLPLQLVASVDADTLASLVPDPTRRALLSAVLAELAELREAQGRAAEAEALRARAVSLADALDAAALAEPVREVLERARIPW
ncbi:MAG: hypothetical protein A2138_14295 [Deltaproteobacteria bacterium RBG_16_71_12]|nr:MAG: hypothetical protein A2138_14295 [Deltaproteobacteria bacterium RBG_16_71_12]